MSRALRSMERLRNDALQTRDPGFLAGALGLAWVPAQGRDTSVCPPHNTFARTNSARSALVACTVSIAFSAAPSSCTIASSCSAHPAFPAPSIFEGGKEFASLGRNRAAGMQRHEIRVPCAAQHGALAE